MKKKLLSVMLAVSMLVSTSSAFATIGGSFAGITTGNTSSSSAFQTGNWDSKSQAFKCLPGYGGRLKETTETTYHTIGSGSNKLSPSDEFYGEDSNLTDKVVAFDLKKSKGLSEVGIQIKNVRYTGEDGNSKLVDIKLVCTDYKDGPDKRSNKAECIQFYKNVYPVIWVSGVERANIEYKFYEAGTNNPTSIKSNFTVTDIDDSEGVAFMNASFSNVVVASNTVLDKRIYQGTYPCVFGPKDKNYTDHDARTSVSLNFNTAVVSIAYLDGNPSTVEGGPARTEEGKLAGRQYYKGLKTETDSYELEREYHRTGWYNGESGDDVDAFLKLSGDISLVGDERYATTMEHDVEMPGGVRKDVTRKYYKGRFKKKGNQSIFDVYWDNFRNGNDAVASGYDQAKWSVSTGREPIPGTKVKATGSGYIGYREDYEGRTPITGGGSKTTNLNDVYRTGSTYGKATTSASVSDWREAGSPPSGHYTTSYGSEVLNTATGSDSEGSYKATLYGHTVVQVRVYQSGSKKYKEFRDVVYRDYRVTQYDTKGGNIIRATKHWKESNAEEYASLSFYYETFVKHFPEGDMYWVDTAKFSAGKSYTAPEVLATPIVYAMKHTV